MATSAPAATAIPPASWQHKAVAVATLAVAAAALYYVDSLPAAVSVEDRSWSLSYPSSLELYGLPETQIFEFNGAVGAGLDVRANTVRLLPQTLDSAAQGGLPPPTTKATSLVWLGKVDTNGKISVAISNQHKAGNAGVAILPTGTAQLPQVKFTAIDTALKVVLHANTGDSGSMPPIMLKIGGIAVGQPIASMMPVSFELPPGESMLMTFASQQSVNDASFRLGLPSSDGELHSHLPVDRFAIARRGNQADGRASPVDRSVCSARAGEILFTHLRPRIGDCGTGGDLALETFDVNSGKVLIGASGSGYETKDGRAVAAGLFSAIANNKVVAALLAIAYTTLAAWVWKTLTGRGRP